MSSLVKKVNIYKILCSKITYLNSYIDLVKQNPFLFILNRTKLFPIAGTMGIYLYQWEIKLKTKENSIRFLIDTIVISSTKDLWVLIININLISLILKFEMLLNKYPNIKEKNTKDLYYNNISRIISRLNSKNSEYCRYIIHGYNEPKILIQLSFQKLSFNISTLKAETFFSMRRIILDKENMLGSINIIFVGDVRQLPCTIYNKRIKYIHLYQAPVEQQPITEEWLRKLIELSSIDFPNQDIDTDDWLVKLSTLSLFDKMVGWYSKLIIPIRHHEQGYKGKYNRRFNVDLFIDIYIFSLIFFFF